MWPYYMFDCMRRFQQGQGVIWPIFTTVAICALYSAVANYFVFSVFKWGLTGVSHFKQRMSHSLEHLHIP